MYTHTHTPFTALGSLKRFQENLPPPPKKKKKTLSPEMGRGRVGAGVLWGDPHGLALPEGTLGLEDPQSPYFLRFSTPEPQ